MLTNLAAGLILGLLLIFFSVIVLIHFRVKTGKFFLLDVNEKFVSARMTLRWWSIMASIYAGSMGIGMLFSVPQTGASIWFIGVLSYAVASSTPFWIMHSMTETVRKTIGKSGFSISDFIYVTIGPIARYTVTTCAVFFMWIFFTAELTAIGDIFKIFTETSWPHVATTIPISFVVIGYTLWGGLYGSIVTDRIQSIICFIMATVTVVYVFYFTSQDLDLVAAFSATIPSRGDWSSIIAGSITIFLSVTINELINEASWQKVLAAKTDKDAKLGLGLATGFILFTVFSFGLLGILGHGAKLEGIIYYPDGMEYMSLILLLVRMPNWFLILIAIFSVCLVCSTLDSLVNGMLAVFAKPMKENNINLNWARLCIAILTLPAIIVATLQVSVLQLFLVSNIVACSCVPPFLLSLHDRVRVSDIAYIVGFSIGILTIFVCGWSYEKTFAGGFQWFVFPRGPFAIPTMVTFILVIVTSVLATYIVSFYIPRVDPPLQDFEWDPPAESEFGSMDGDSPAFPDKSYHSESDPDLIPETISESPAENQEVEV